MSRTVDTSGVSSWHIDLVQGALDELGEHGQGFDPAELVASTPWSEARWVRLRDALGVEINADGTSSVLCRPCIHATLFGWWGYPLLRDLNAHTHCKTCHRSWRGIKEAHCTVCHEQFASNEAAGKHWVDDKHIHPSEVKGRDGKPRFCATEDEFGVVWTLCRHQDLS